MTKAQHYGLCLLLLGCVLFLLAGFHFETTSTHAMQDFRVIYNPALCLIHHCDPYQESEVLRISRAEGEDRSTDTAEVRRVVTHYLYPPTAFSFTVPFAMLPWDLAQRLWMLLTMGSLILASILAWNLGANYAPILSGALIGYLLANSELLIILGNPTGVAVSLCVVAVWCFLRDRFVSAGILCLAISLALKPHGAGMVWLFFLLAGGKYRKCALQTLLLTAALSLPAVLWVWWVSPHWMQELRSNIATFSVHGGLADPGPASSATRGGGMMINLQTVISLFRDDPRFYNPVTYLVCTPLLLLWVLVTLRSPSSTEKAWLGIAAIVPLSMLPVYHHLFDAKLLLLTVPACAILWKKGGVTGRLALLMNIAGLVLTADLTWAIIYALADGLHLSPVRLAASKFEAELDSPAPLILLVMGIFYLWVYVRRSSSPTLAADAESAGPA